MPEKIKVISADLDGRQLRKEKTQNSYFIRCYGKKDNEQIQDAINSVGKISFTIPTEKWESIFEGKK